MTKPVGLVGLHWHYTELDTEVRVGIRTRMTKSYRTNKEMSKLILVLGATGAQGRAVVNSLLAPSEDGTSSPYAVRALSRDPESKHALSLRDQGVEVFRGRSPGISA